MASVSMDVKTPAPIMGHFDAPMWQSVRDRRMRLQRCEDCGEMHYPPGAACPHCLSMKLRWEPLSGNGTIVSWVVFHKTYLDAYPAPYNVIAVELSEGPIVVSNLEGDRPDGEWIGLPVTLVYATMPDGAVLPRFALAAGNPRA